MTWQNRSSRTCAGPARHAVGLSLIVSVIILDAHQVGVGLRAEMCSDADDMLVGCIYHLLHLENKQDVYFIILGETSGCCWSNDQKCSTHNTEYIDKLHQTWHDREYISIPNCGIVPLQQQQHHLSEASFGNVNVTVAHLHVDPQAFHHRQTVLVVPQVLWNNSPKMLNHVCKKSFHVCQ